MRERRRRNLRTEYIERLYTLLLPGNHLECCFVQAGLLRVSLQLHKWGEDEAPQAPKSSAAGARIEAPKAPRGVGCGKWRPLPTRGGGCAPSPEFFFDFGSQYGEFWCILGGIFYSSATCFTRKTGVIWCPSPYFFLIFRFQKDLVHFLAFWHRQKLS